MVDLVMEHISREVMLGAADTIDRLKPLANRYTKLMELLQGSTVSCSGLDITINFSDHDTKDAVMNLLCGE